MVVEGRGGTLSVQADQEARADRLTMENSFFQSLATTTLPVPCGLRIVAGVF